MPLTVNHAALGGKFTGPICVLNTLYQPAVREGGSGVCWKNTQIPAKNTSCKEENKNTVLDTDFLCLNVKKQQTGLACHVCIVCPAGGSKDHENHSTSWVMWELPHWGYLRPNWVFQHIKNNPEQTSDEELLNVSPAVHDKN